VNSTICQRCHRGLKDPDSIKAGMGKVCRKKSGVSPAEAGAPQTVHGDLPLATINTVYRYKGYSDCDCHCQLRIWYRDMLPPVAVVTELNSNTGTSVTNMCEYLWHDIVSSFNLPSDTVFIEHYPEDPASKRDLPNRYSRITFLPATQKNYGLPHKKALGKPSWESISLETIDSILKVGVQAEEGKDG